MMKTPTLQIAAFLTCIVAVAEDKDPLPDRVKKLQEDYLSAVARATAPLTSTYLKELEKLKMEFTKAGDLPAALATDHLISAAKGTVEPTELAEMSERQFKRWLESVTITEVDSPYGLRFVYEDDLMVSMRPDRSGRRVHQTATFEVGKVEVPFTNTTARIVISPSLDNAEISYSNGGGQYKATITKR